MLISFVFIHFSFKIDCHTILVLRFPSYTSGTQSQTSDGLRVLVLIIILEVIVTAWLTTGKLFSDVIKKIPLSRYAIACCSKK